MARRYSAVGDQAVGTDQSIVSIGSATTIRPKIYNLIIGCSATPGDTATRFLLQTASTAGTNTSVTPGKVDLADPASLATAGSNHTAEPGTLATIWLDVNLNQRATYQWYATPGAEFTLLAVATANAGHCATVKSAASTGTAEHRATILWAE